MDIAQTVRDAVNGKAVPGDGDGGSTLETEVSEQTEKERKRHNYEGFTDTEDEMHILIEPVAFDVALGRYISSSRESRQMARLCAELAIIEFYNHDNLSKAQQFFDAINANYGRKPAFAKWLTEHCPVRMNLETKRLKKDKSDTAKEWALEKALAVPFWEFAPEKEIIEFNIDDLMKAVKSVLNKHRNTDKYTAKDEATLARLTKLELAVSAVT